MDFTFLLEEIIQGFRNFTPGNGIMIAAGVILITRPWSRNTNQSCCCPLALDASWRILACLLMWAL